MTQALTTAASHILWILAAVMITVTLALRAHIKYRERQRAKEAARRFENNPDYVDMVPQTEENHLSAVTRKGYALRYIKNPSFEVCLAAVKNTDITNMPPMVYVPEKHQTPLVALTSARALGRAYITHQEEQRRPDIMAAAKYVHQVREARMQRIMQTQNDFGYPGPSSTQGDLIRHVIHATRTRT